MDDLDLVAYGGEGRTPIEPPRVRSRAQLASLYATNVRLRNQEEVDRIRAFVSPSRSRPVEVACVDHETAHLASAALCSGFERCTAIAVDGYGDDRSGAVGSLEGGRLELVASSPLRSSVGLVYGMTTLALGLSIWHDEGKVTALSGYPSGTSPELASLYERLMPLPAGAALQPSAEALLAWLDEGPAIPRDELRRGLHPTEVVRPAPRWRPERTDGGYVLLSPTGEPVGVAPLAADEFRALWYTLRRSPSAHAGEVAELAAPLVGMRGEELWPALLPSVELRERDGAFSALLGGGASLRLSERERAIYSLCDGALTAAGIAQEVGAPEREVRDLVELSPLCRTLWTGGEAPGAADPSAFVERSLSALGSWLSSRAVERPPLGPHRGTFIDSASYASLRRRLLGSRPRAAVARALQRRLEEVLSALASQAVERTGHARVAAAGGVFFNVLANMRLRRLPMVEDLFVQPAAGDAGTSVGAALAAWRARCPGARVPARLESAAMGPSYSREDVLAALRGASGVAWEEASDPAGTAADLVASGRVVGWFDGRMEFGPRALGNRSVLADPRDPLARERLNLLLKGREWFQPFCPSLPLERAREYLVDGREAPFMIEAFEVPEAKRREVPAVVHADGTTRPQTVRRDLQPSYHRLLAELESRTGVPVVLNTSFNLHGEPIACTPRDALGVLLRRGVDALVMEGFVARRSRGAA
jgi:predicted NodU family carbamoyl transferase